MARLRISKLPKAIYRKILTDTKFNDSDESEISPSELEDWGRIIIRFNLNGQIPFQEWVFAIYKIRVFMISSPLEFDTLSFEQITEFFSEDDNANLIIMLWQACAISTNPNRANCFTKINLAVHGGILAQSLRRKDIDNTIYSKKRTEIAQKLDLPINFDLAFPSTKIKILAEFQSSEKDVSYLLNSDVALNVIRQCQDSIPSVSSGIQRYAAFCDLTGAQYFPPISANIRRWGSLFITGKSFGNYCGHLAKACQILDISTDWYGDSVHAIAKGLVHARGYIATFDNFIFKELFIKIINRESIQTEFGRLCYISFVFLLWVHSDGIPSIRASNADRITEKSAIVRQALIGVRDIAGDDRLRLKLRKRKNNRDGSVLTRPFFCPGSIIAGRGFCPIHDFRPQVKRYRPIGPNLSPSLLKKNAIRISKGSLSSLNIEGDGRYSLKGFRRGCIMEIKRSGSALAVILGSGGRKADGFRAYLSIQGDEEASLKSLLIGIQNNIDSDSANDSDGDKKKN